MLLLLFTGVCYLLDGVKVALLTAQAHFLDSQTSFVKVYRLSDLGE